MGARTLALIAVVVAAGAFAPAGPINGGFEEGLTGWDASGPAASVTFELSRDFLPGVSPDWLPQVGTRFASIRTAQVGGPNVAELEQTFDADAGSVLSFWYFFDFGDVASNPDWARATLAYGSEVVELFAYNTAPGNALGSDQDIDWTLFSLTLPSSTTYTIRFEAGDANGAFESILGVDEFVPEPGALFLLAAVLAVGRRR